MEEHKMRVFENRFMGRIFGLKKVEVTGYWSKRIIRSIKIFLAVQQMLRG
jgi:hypothetical protein